MSRVPTSVLDHSRINLLGQAVLHGVSKGATYEEILVALEDRFGDQHLAAVYRIG
jgi:hypothetical protein